MTVPDPTYNPPPDDQAIGAVLPATATKRPPSPDDSQLAARWIVKNRQAAYGLGQFRRYADGVWTPVDRDAIRKEVKAIIDNAKADGVRASAGLLSSVVELARVEIAIPAEKWDAAAEYLPCANGVLHIPTKSLLPHTPDIYATSRLDYDYDATATCPNFMQALQQIPDAVDFFQEFAGYALTTEVKHEIAIWMHGPPGTGKSTVLAGLQAMLGARAGLLGIGRH
jgi:putative DNA primase/helicase